MNLPPSSSLDLTPNPAAGCLSSILRRLLCRIDDTDAELNTTKSGAEPEKPPSSPGLVARLMGLESMPPQSVYPNAGPESLLRCRSTSSLGSWPGRLILPHKRTSSDPQMIKASASFREAPTYLRQENEDFLLLSFAPDDGGGALPELGSGEFEEGGNARTASKAKKERRRTVEKKTVERSTMRRECRCREKATDKEHRVDVMPLKKEAHRKPSRERSNINTRKRSGHGHGHACSKLELECSSSQDSSPVSVLDPHLDDGEFSSLSPESPVTDTKTNQRDSRRKLLPSDLADRKDASLHLSNIHHSRISRDERKIAKNEPIRNLEQDWYSFSCRLADEDMKRWNWVSRKIHESEDVGELAAVVGLELLDFLLHEAVDELLDCNMTLLKCT